MEIHRKHFCKAIGQPHLATDRRFADVCDSNAKNRVSRPVRRASLGRLQSAMGARGMSQLKGKVALVTGASRGIATAERLAADGCAVVVNYARSASEAEATVAAIRAQGGMASAVQADMGAIGDIERLFASTLAQFGRLDVLVANAGACTFKPLIETTEEDFDHMFAVNAKGVYFCLREAARHMVDGGRIVCVSTIGTVMNMPGGSCYFGTKGAIEQFCRVFAREVAPRGITVNLVSPGFVETSMLKGLLADVDPTVPDELLAMTPLSRFGRPEDIAGAIAFLAGPGAEWMTRQNLAVDGGIVGR